MKSKDELKEIDFKNRMFYYVNDIIRFWDRDLEFSDILLNQKSYKENYENILTDNLSYKTSTAAKRVLIMFDKIDEFIKNP